jgi:hypothetical protein
VLWCGEVLLNSRYGETGAFYRIALLLEPGAFSTAMKNPPGKVCDARCDWVAV